MFSKGLYVKVKTLFSKVKESIKSKLTLVAYVILNLHGCFHNIDAFVRYVVICPMTCIYRIKEKKQFICKLLLFEEICIYFNLQICDYICIMFLVVQF